MEITRYDNFQRLSDEYAARTKIWIIVAIFTAIVMTQFFIVHGREDSDQGNSKEV
jgi:hypothetical protein